MDDLDATTNLIDVIDPGDRVTISTPHGKMTGKAQLLLIFHDHVVLNMGGRSGTPRTADWRNIVSIRKGKGNG